MKYTRWLAALVAVVALALVAGCGSSSSSTSSSTTSSSGSLGGTDTSASSGSSTTSSSSSGGSSNQAVADFKSSCDDLVNSLPSAGQSAAQTGCDQAAQALQQCVDQSPSAAAVKTCEATAKQAEATLKQAAAATP